MTAHRTPATTGRCAKIVVFLLALAAFPAPRPLNAQVAVFPTQNLSFGTLRAGAAEYVDCADATRRAELEIFGSGNVVVTFSLPSEMVSSAGHRLALSFSNGDAVVELKGGKQDKSFDPNKPYQVKITGKDRGGTIFLGGMALPDASQAPGRYTATITVQVVTPGT
jgi:hypothetical protein